MNHFISIISNYLDRWKLTINEDKCETILFRKYETFISKAQRQYRLNANVAINIKNHTIYAKDQIKYLGIIFDKKCSTIPHVNNLLRKAKGAYAMLGGVFKRKSLTRKTKEICYKQLIRPILQYAFPGWCDISAHQMSRIRAFERKILYKCLPFEESHYYDNFDDIHKLIRKKDLYNKFIKLKRIDKTNHESFIKFMQKLEYTDLDLLKNITNRDFLNEKYGNINNKYLYKSFAPSYLYKLFLDGKMSNARNVLTFYNRRFNSNNLDEYVYDLAEPD